MMTKVTLEIPDQVVQSIERRALSRGLTLSQQVSELLAESTSINEDPVRTDAIRRMNELFEQVSGFQVERCIPREELYERGSLR